MNYKQAHSALLQHWQGGALGLTTYYPNAAQPDTPQLPHARLSLLDARADLLTLRGKCQRPGVLQIDLLYPLDTGTGAALDMADAVLARFAPGTRLADGLVTVGAGSARTVQDSGALRVVVSVEYLIFF